MARNVLVLFFDSFIRLWFFHLASIPQTYQMIMIYFGHLLNAGLSGEQSKGAAVLMGILKESAETDCDLPTMG